jgi:hypothetical protein
MSKPNRTDYYPGNMNLLSIQAPLEQSQAFATRREIVGDPRQESPALMLLFESTSSPSRFSDDVKTALSSFREKLPLD